ncbi:MAG: CPBP family intramembrane metalloprotease [Phycisphaerales bacterium]|nr:CPBP family intramembrane metalloprotease [Phycisphaerales bacterium]
MRMVAGPVRGFIAGAAVYASCLVFIEIMSRTGTVSGAFAVQVTFKAVLAGVSVVLMLTAGRSLGRFGWCRPRATARDWIVPLASGVGLGAIASMLVLGLATPLALMRSFSFVELVLGIWIWSTVTEEIFVRGLVQTWMSSGGAGRGRGVVIVASGLFFGAMHLTLLMRGEDHRTVAIIVTMTTCLGFVCGWSRARTGSVVIPILAHGGFNVGGLLGGVAWVVGAKLLT